MWTVLWWDWPLYCLLCWLCFCRFLWRNSWGSHQAFSPSKMQNDSRRQFFFLLKTTKVHLVSLYFLTSTGSCLCYSTLLISTDGTGIASVQQCSDRLRVRRRASSTDQHGRRQVQLPGEGQDLPASLGSSRGEKWGLRWPSSAYRRRARSTSQPG